MEGETAIGNKPRSSRMRIIHEVLFSSEQDVGQFQNCVEVLRWKPVALLDLLTIRFGSDLYGYPHLSKGLPADVNAVKARPPLTRSQGLSWRFTM